MGKRLSDSEKIIPTIAGSSVESPKTIQELKLYNAQLEAKNTIYMYA